MFAYGDRACLYARGVAAAELENASIFRYERVANVVSVAYCDGALGDLPDDVGDPDGPDASVVGLEVGGEPRAGNVAVELLGTFAAKKVEDETVEEFEEVRRREDGESELGSPPPAVMSPALCRAADGLGNVVRLDGLWVDVAFPVE